MHQQPLMKRVTPLQTPHLTQRDTGRAAYVAFHTKKTLGEAKTQTNETNRINTF